MKSNTQVFNEQISSKKDFKSLGIWDTIFREFDPGSGRTLAACLTHASRTELDAGLMVACYRISLFNLVADGWVTRE